MISRELVKSTLEFKNTNQRAPRQLWLLPWSTERYSRELERIHADFPDDIVEVPPEHKVYLTPPPVNGSWYAKGDYLDEWGCMFRNLQDGVIGEVKEPIVAASDEDWADTSRIRIPEELLTLDTDKVNAFCRSTEKFVLASDLARPFERLQFIRGTENLFVDLITRPKNMMAFVERMHDFYCRLLTLWARTEVDGLFFMDDWGTQVSLLINPALWVELIKPMYRDYSDIAKKHGKKIFFHSDGNTLEIIPHLIDIGIDAANLQIFCIGLDKLKQFKGKITFWGEIDRQRLLPYGSTEEIASAVKAAKEALWQDGGAIAQCEFGVGAKPKNVYTVFETWNALLP